MPESRLPTDPALYGWLEQNVQTCETGELLGRGYQAAVYGIASPFGPIVVKKAHASGILGMLGRRTLRHEAKTYERLQGVTGTIECFGLIEGRYLALARIQGDSLRAKDKALADPDRLYARLLAALDAMHDAGVAHGDLKRKNNILVGPCEQPYIIDFGIAWRCSAKSSAVHRAIFRAISQMDYNAWMKHKHGRPPYGADVPAEDLARYRPLLLERIARAIRIPWQKLTLRRLRKRHRQNRSGK